MFNILKKMHSALVYTQKVVIKHSKSMLDKIQYLMPDDLLNKEIVQDITSDAVIQALYEKYHAKPLKENKVVFSSFNGRGYGHDPKYIAEELLRQRSDLDLVWLTKDEEELPSGIRAVSYDSVQAIKEIATARVLISNTMMCKGFQKRSDQCYINTLHDAISLKKIGYDDSVNRTDTQCSDMDACDFSGVDLMLSNSSFASRMYRRALGYKGEIMESGCPRSDILLKDPGELKTTICQKLHLPGDAKYILYAPICRSDCSLDKLTLDCRRVLDELGDDYFLLICLYPGQHDQAEALCYSGRMIDISGYPDMQEIMAISDMLITDYSNIMFEFAMTGRPVFLLANDIEEYRKQHDCYFDILELPFPACTTTDELLTSIKTFDLKKYKKLVSLFMANKIGIFESGHASLSIANIIMQLVGNKAVVIKQALDNVQINNDKMETIFTYIANNFKRDISIYKKIIKKGVFHIDFEKEIGVKQIKIYNAERGKLSLRGVELYHGGVRVDVEDYRYDMGETYNHTPKKFSFNLLVNPYQFVTKRQKSTNWLIIDMAETVQLDSLAIYTRVNASQYRNAHSMCLECRGADGHLLYTYDMRHHLDSINNEVYHYIKHRYPLSNTRALEYLCSLFINLHAEKYSAFDEYIDEASKYGINKDIIIDFINNKMKEKHLHYSLGYGFKRTFEFWTEQERYEYLLSSQKALNIIRKKYEHSFFAYGTLLGFVREKTYFIPHDHDIDIICIVPLKKYKTNKVFFDEISLYLVENGIRITNYNKNCLHIKHGSHELDIFCGLEDTDGGIIIVPYNRGKYLNASFLFPTTEMDIMGISCPVPKEPITFLESYYGSNWRIPIDKNWATKY